MHKQMKYTSKKIYDLLPAIYRQRDGENGFQLKALLDIVAEQIEIVQNDIKNLYDNWFIETCQDWVIPYIGDLLQVRIPYPVSNATYNQRAWVANTIGYRRRKGTIAMLEALARDVTGWDSKAVEFFDQLVTTQYLNHLRLHNLVTPDLRDTERLERISIIPFNTVAHNFDVRSIRKRRGYYNIPNIGIFLWRIQSLPVINAPAFDYGEGRFTFNRLGYDEPIYNHKTSTVGVAGMAEEKNISAPIRMRILNGSIDDYYFDDAVSVAGSEVDDNNENDSIIGCGDGNVAPGIKSIQIIVNRKARSIKDIVVCDLRDWIHRPPSGKIAIDPSLGRILFPADEVPESVHTIHYYGFSSEIGGGFYNRPEPSYLLVGEGGGLAFKKEIVRTFHHYNVRNSESTLAGAISTWKAEGRKDAIIEIQDSEFYEESNIEISLPANTLLIIKSSRHSSPVSQGEQPVLLLKDPIKIRGEEIPTQPPNEGGEGSSSRSVTIGGRVIFDGLLFDNLPQSSSELVDSNMLFNIESGNISSVAFHHCTLVPGRNASSFYDSKQIFSNWDEILTDPASITRLKSFLLKTFSALSWLDDQERPNGTNLKFESLPGNKSIKISLVSSPPDANADAQKPFITIEPNIDMSVATVLIHNYNADINERGDSNGRNGERDISSSTTATIPQKAYEFILMKEEDSKIGVYCPKLSLLVTPMPPRSTVASSHESGHTAEDFDYNNSLYVSVNSTICGTIFAVTATSSSSSLISTENEIQLSNSILDGKGSERALYCFRSRIENSTIFGKVKVIILGIASNVMFTDIVTVRRLQQGCVRFCYIDEKSRTPRRYKCQPEYFNSLPASSKRRNSSEEEDYDDTLLNIHPRFTSTIYGDPGYAQLHWRTSTILFEGADNGSEIGVFNNLYLAQRLKNLRSSLDEYLRFGLEAGIFFVDFERENEVNGE